MSFRPVIDCASRRAVRQPSRICLDHLHPRVWRLMRPIRPTRGEGGQPRYGIIPNQGYFRRPTCGTELGDKAQPLSAEHAIALPSASSTVKTDVLANI